MSNKRFTKGIPQSAFEYRDQLVSDFFLFYELRFDEIEVLRVKKRLTETPTPEQMAEVLKAANLYWSQYIENHGLPRTLVATLTNKIKEQWKSMEVHISKRPRKSRKLKTESETNNSSTN